jgi:hypothetical protein
MEGLEAKHGARDPLYETVILFHDVVEVFDLKDLYGFCRKVFYFPPNGSKPPAFSRPASANLLLIFSPEF